MYKDLTKGLFLVKTKINSFYVLKRKQCLLEK